MGGLDEILLLSDLSVEEGQGIDIEVYLVLLRLHYNIIVTIYLWRTPSPAIGAPP